MINMKQSVAMKLLDCRVIITMMRILMMAVQKIKTKYCHQTIWDCLGTSIGYSLFKLWPNNPLYFLRKKSKLLAIGKTWLKNLAILVTHLE